MLGLPGVSSTALPFFVGGAGVANGLRTVLFAAGVADGALAGVVLAGVPRPCMLGLPGVSSTTLPFFVRGAGVANGLRTVLFAAAVVFGRSADSCSALCFANGALAGVVLAGVLNRSFFVGGVRPGVRAGDDFLPLTGVLGATDDVRRCLPVPAHAPSREQQNSSTGRAGAHRARVALGSCGRVERAEPGWAVAGDRDNVNSQAGWALAAVGVCVICSSHSRAWAGVRAVHCCTRRGSLVPSLLGLPRNGCGKGCFGLPWATVRGCWVGLPLLPWVTSPGDSWKSSLLALALALASGANGFGSAGAEPALPAELPWTGVRLGPTTCQPSGVGRTRLELEAPRWELEAPICDIDRCSCAGVGLAMGVGARTPLLPPALGCSCS